MRKSWLPLLLSCLLILVQLGALAHEIGHQRIATAGTHGAPAEPAADGVCRLCLAFSQLAAFARPVTQVVATDVAQHIQQSRLAPATPSAGIARTGNRDPPGDS